MRKLFSLSRAQCRSWCCPRACQEAGLMWTLDPGLGPMFGRRVCLFAGLDARCPGARRWWSEGPIGFGLAAHPWGMLDFTGGSPGSRALYLFSLHKDFQLGPPWWQCSCMSSPSVTLPCRKIHSLHVASCYVGFWPCIWAIVEVLDFPGETGNPPSSPWAADFFTDCWTRWAVPDSHVDDGRSKQSIFCRPAPEGDTALGVWEDLNWILKYLISHFSLGLSLPSLWECLISHFPLVPFKTPEMKPPCVEGLSTLCRSI